MKCLNPLKIFLNCLINRGGSKCAPEPKVTGNLMKCLNPLKIVFTVWPMGKADWVVGVSKYAPEPKLQ